MSSHLAIHRSGSIAGLVIFLLLWLAGIPLLGQNPHLVKNLNTRSAGSDPWGAVQLGCRVLVSADNGVAGREIWTIRIETSGDEDDCSPHGSPRVRLLRDINPGSASSGAHPVLRIGDRALIAANDGTHGPELWITDGTEAGTRLVADIRTGASGSRPHDLVALGSDVYFVATDEAHGTELWRTDGLGSSTELVYDFLPGPVSSDPTDLVVAFDSVLLLAEADTGLQELWRVYPSGLATRLLEGIVPAFQEPGVPRLVPSGPFVYFTAAAADAERRLWRTDGSREGTIEVRGAGAAILHHPEALTAFGDRLALQADDGNHGPEPWITDGSAGGTSMLRDIHAGASGSEPADFLEWQGEIYFSATSIEYGRELWKSDGSDNGTRLVRDVEAMPGLSSSPTRLIGVGDVLLFRATTWWAGTELWTTDGTWSNTKLLKSINNAYFHGGLASRYQALGERVIFPANDGLHGLELWITDGTAAGTFMLRDINLRKEYGWLYPYTTLLGQFGGKALFSARDGHHGTEIWETDGTTGGTALVSDIRRDAFEGSDPLPLVAAGTEVYFGPRDYPFGLWKTDGSPTRTKPIELNGKLHEDAIEYGGHLYFDGLRLDPSSGDEVPLITSEGNPLTYANDFTVLDDILYYFRGSRHRSPRELWRTDGSAAGTWRVKYLGNSFFAHVGPRPVATSSHLFFAAEDTNGAGSLWSSDGTPDGTFPLPVGCYESYCRDLHELQPMGRTLFFVNRLSQYGERQIWMSDGSFAGTHSLFPDELPQPFDNPRELTTVGEILFFIAYDPEHGEELWRTDGTVAGTVLVKDITPPGCYRDFLEPGHGELTEHEGLLYFRGFTCPKSWDLWRSDGTGEGTVMVKDIEPGSLGRLESLSEHLLFDSRSESFGYEFWLSDGTEEGTSRIANHLPDEGWYRSSHTVEAGRQAFFRAEDPYYGSELWVLQLPGYWNRLDVATAPAESGRVDSSPPGISCSPFCSAEFAFGGDVTLTPRSYPGWIFNRWTGAEDCSDGVLRITGPSSCIAEFSQCDASETVPLESQVISGDRRFVTCGSIVIGPALEVAAGGSLTLEARGSVTLLNEVSVASAGSLSVKAGGEQ